VVVIVGTMCLRHVVSLSRGRLALQKGCHHLEAYSVISLNELKHVESTWMYVKLANGKAMATSSPLLAMAPLSVTWKHIQIPVCLS
jgi:hypothetical protein